MCGAENLCPDTVPERCPRVSEDGAIMKVHYVGKLLATNKIFADLEEGDKTQRSACWMRLAAWRLTSSTLLALFAHTQPAETGNKSL